MINNNYEVIYKHYEECYIKHGDNNLGVDWPNKNDLIKRYKLMLNIIIDKNKSNTILDFGAGCGGLYEYILDNSININYNALDISKIYCDRLEEKFKNINIYNIDILQDNIDLLPNFDYIIMNGVFTEKRDLSDEEMWNFLTNVLVKIIKKTNIGISFNVMTPNVDWKEPYLYYLSFDKITKFLKENISKNFNINQSYGLWEYTIYIYKNPIEI